MDFVENSFILKHGSFFYYFGNPTFVNWVETDLCFKFNLIGIISGMEQYILDMGLLQAVSCCDV